MAQLTATITTSCDGNQKGLVHFSDLSDPNSQGGDTYSWYVNLAGNALTSGPIERGQTVNYGPLDDGNYTFGVGNDLTGERSELLAVRLNCGGTAPPDPTPDPGDGGGPTPPSTGPSGCTTPRALNYDPSASQDTTPSACVFVVAGELPDLVAAHLPIPLVVRASPSVGGYASIVVLHLLTAPALTGPWVEFGQLRGVCDETASAAFDLSEAAKSLLRIQPPVEAGEDPALSALLQVSYEVFDPQTGALSYAGPVGTCRVLNAVREPVAGAVLTTPTPYATMPVGAVLWATTATLQGGVLATPTPLPTDGCHPRQFVWLNPAGAWDSGFFYGRHVHGTDQADPVAYRDASGADRYARRGTVRPTLQVYSDKLDFATYQALAGVRDSVQVYERVGPGQYRPVLVSSESYTGYQEQTDKTFTVNFTVSYPAQLIQTQ